MHDWFKNPLRVDPSFGYFAEAGKCFLIVDDLFRDEAGEIFKSFNINFVTSQRFLGVMIGDRSVH